MTHFLSVSELLIKGSHLKLNLKRENKAIFNIILINHFFVKTVGSVTKGWEGTGTGGGGGGATKSGAAGRKIQKFS